jgi:hypothetical protein
MKNFVREVFFGTNSLLSGLIALAVVGSIVLGCNCNKEFGTNTSSTSNSSTTTTPADTKPSDTDGVPSTSVVEGLVKDTIAEFNDAVQSGDFSAMHANASQDFQSTYSVEEMETAFKSYTEKKKVVAPIFSKIPSMSADFSSPPGLRTEKSLKILMAKGEFNTKPYKTRFDFEYVMRGGEWKLLKLIVNVP